MKFWSVRIMSIVIALAGTFVIPVIFKAVLGFPERLAFLAGLYVTLAVSLNLINGISGQFSIGHAAFYMIGAYGAGKTTMLFYANQPMTASMWLVAMVIVGALCSGFAGFVVGLPSLRLRGDYLAIVTLGFGEIVRIAAQNIEEVGGSYGMSIDPPMRYPWMSWALAILCIAVCRNLLKSAHGLQYLAVREDEMAASAMGVNVTKVKVSAFVIGSAFAGAAGALLAHYDVFISPTTFSMDLSFMVLTMVVLGGTGSITGSVLAAVVLFAIPEYLRDFKEVPASVVLALLIALGLWLVAARRIQGQHHLKGIQRTYLHVANAVVAAGVLMAFGTLLSNIPALVNKACPIGSVRWVVFAVTLIAVMMLRPQGILGHAEFSWNGLAKLFGATNRREVQS